MRRVLFSLMAMDGLRAGLPRGQRRWERLGTRKHGQEENARILGFGVPCGWVRLSPKA
ncbi:hypothetical protein S1OALGB6SA_835 [Olavius algarvensis spirochete endosymbiont]|nr:hypothetical protein S1OALGB6SA_835 [Olavius algarvensis spirochete endosymbiont]